MTLIGPDSFVPRALVSWLGIWIGLSNVESWTNDQLMFVACFWCWSQWNRSFPISASFGIRGFLKHCNFNHVGGHSRREH